MASGGRVEAATDELEEDLELLPMDLLLDDSPNEVVDVGDKTMIEAARKLVVQIGDEAVDYPIIKNLMTIGRGHGADIRIASHFVSRVHAKISTKGIATIIEDAGSKNGTHINQDETSRRELVPVRPGDMIRFGSVESIVCGADMFWKLAQWA